MARSEGNSHDPDDRELAIRETDQKARPNAGLLLSRPESSVDHGSAALAQDAFVNLAQATVGRQASSVRYLTPGSAV